MKHTITIITFLLCSSTIINAQSNQFGFVAGPSYASLVNSQASDKEYGSFGFSPMLSYRFENANSRNYGEAAGYFHTLRCNSDNSYISTHQSRFRFARLWQLPWSAFNRVKLLAGGSAASLLHLSEFHSTGSGSFVNLYQWTHSLDAAFQVEWSRTIPTGREFVSCVLYVPVVTNMARTPGDARSANETDIKVFGKTQMLGGVMPWQVTITYQLPLTSKLNLQVNCELYHSNNDNNESIALHMQTVRIGMSASF